MTTKRDLRKLGEAHGSNMREITLNRVIEITIEEIRYNARKNITSYTAVLCAYRDDEDYCNTFLTSIRHAFPDIDVHMTYEEPKKYYEFSWKD